MCSPRSLLLALFVFLVMFLAIFQVPPAHAQSDIDDLLLTFSYPAVGRIYVSAKYDYTTQQVFLPVRELFGLLDINMQRTSERWEVRGTYLTGGKPYVIDFRDFTVTHALRSQQYDQARMLPGETDLFLTTDIFEEMFDLEFTASMSTLTLTLKTPYTLPIVEKTQRELSRSRIRDFATTRNYHPLLYARRHQVVRPGFLDYSVGSSHALHARELTYNYQLTGGIELLGGDFQGTHSGFYGADGKHNFQNGNLRLQYVIPNRSYISRINIGQVSTTGLNAQPVRGITVTNDPIEARMTYGSHNVRGRTDPDSEIEIYLNNQLILFGKADELGDYDFVVPLQFGTTLLGVRIYTPDGGLIISDRQILVPFLFLPPGVAAYNIQAGQIESAYNPLYRDKIAGNASVGVGLTNWLTVRAGSEYLQDEQREFLYYGTVSMRLLSSLLVNTELVPDYFYRTQTSLYTAGASSLTAEHTYFDGFSQYNSRRADHKIMVSYNTPLNLRDRLSRTSAQETSAVTARRGSLVSAGIRFGIDHTTFGLSSETRHVSDLYLRVKSINLRFNYRDNLFYSHPTGDFRATGGQLGVSATYTVSRRSVYRMLRGTYFRTSTLYDRQTGEFRQLDGQIAVALPGNGRLTIGGGHQFASSRTTVSIGISLDLNRTVRSLTDYRGGNEGSHVVRQSFRGSIGYDDQYNQFLFTDRQQVGRSAVSVLLYVDENNSGTYDPSDTLIPYDAVRLDRSAGATVGRDGITRLTQLQPYHRYNMEINRQAIPNPQLVPSVAQLSFVTDPNQFKRIEIGFSRAGSIDGMVVQDSTATDGGIAGLRMIITGKQNGYTQSIRTLYGGFFFAMDIPPGEYTLEIDPSQLEFMQATVREGSADFTIRSLSEGDYISDLLVILDLDNQERLPDDFATIAYENEQIKLLMNRVNRAVRFYVMAQDAAYAGRFLDGMQFVDQSLAEMETDYGWALKGTLHYLLGDFDRAREIWDDVTERNSIIQTPNERIFDELPGLQNILTGPRGR